MSSKDARWRDVQYALRHLYEPDTLRKSSLAALVGLQADGDVGLGLRHLLCDAIRDMRPDDDIPPGTRPWRDYQILFHRYVRGCTQLEVADQVGLSVRHLRREEQRAIQSLACRLAESGGRAEGQAGTVFAANVSMATHATVEAEIAWLSTLSAEEPSDLSAVLEAALETVTPLAAQRGVCIAQSGENVAHPVAVNPVVARQALIVVLAVAIRSAESGGIQVCVVCQERDVEVSLAIGMQGEALPTLSPEDAERLDLVRCLLKPCGGKVIAGYERGALVLTTAFPTLERTPVLAIEDNADTVRLLDRFLANTRFSLYSASGIDQALSLALSIAPQAIILDVVMPQVDGWESLQRLRHHPATQAVPVLVCTILPEEELALSLGAAAYVHKPFTREELVRVLDRLVAQKA